MLYQVLLTVCLVPAVLGKACCLPNQWEGQVFGVSLYRFRISPPVKEGEGYSIAYDATNKKVAVYGTPEANTVKRNFKIIDDYNENKRYFILPDVPECRISPLDKEFPNPCIPDTSTVLGKSFVGAGADTLEITTYKTELKRDGEDIVSYTAVTTDGCIPIYDDLAGKDDTTKYFENSNYVGITAGIKDADVFNPPDYCNEVTFDLIRDKHPRNLNWRNY